MLTQPLRALAVALTLMGAATATELPRKADELRPHPAMRARHRPAPELTDGCRVEPVVAAPAPPASFSCTDTTAASREARQ